MARYMDVEVAEKMLRDYADDVGCKRGEYELSNGILKAVSYIRNNIPTAYDVDAVVAELEEFQKTNFEAYEVATHIPDKIGYINTSNAYANAINIVKRGGLG